MTYFRYRKEISKVFNCWRRIAADAPAPRQGSRRAIAVAGLTATLSSLAFSSSAQEIPESQLSVPVSIPLGDLQSYADRALGGVLHEASYGRTCVQPEQTCTKIPEFRGFKVTFKMRCAEISPRIDCNIDERVAREGPIAISGSGGRIVVTQAIAGSATVTGRGEIGKHIQQTIRAAAEVTVTASPRLGADWVPEMKVAIDHRWLQRPEFNLFNIFPISLGSTLGPKLDEALDNYENDVVPREIAKLDLRTEADRLWQALQAPVPLDLPGGVRRNLHIRPDAIGFEGPDFSNNTLSARLALQLRAFIDGDVDGPPRTALPNLTSLPDRGLALRVPVRLTAAQLTAS